MGAMLTSLQSAGLTPVSVAGICCALSGVDTEQDVDEWTSVITSKLAAEFPAYQKVSAHKQHTPSQCPKDASPVMERSRGRLELALVCFMRPVTRKYPLRQVPDQSS
jgi:hypothetical protein